MQLLRDLCRLSREERLRHQDHPDQRSRPDRRQRGRSPAVARLSHHQVRPVCGRRLRARRSGQEDADNDDLGDACDPDADNDNIPNDPVSSLKF